jgi:hypothetical protein
MIEERRTAADSRAPARIVLGFACALFAREARADDTWIVDTFVSPGVVVSWATSPDTSAGAGFEISAGYAQIARPGFFVPHVGAVYRAQGNDAGSSGSYGRHTIALEGGVALLGMELGYAFRDGFAKAPATSGLHVMPYLAIGVLYFGPQLLIPVATASDVEVAFNLGIKAPLPQIVLLPLLAVSLSGANLGNLITH